MFVSAILLCVFSSYLSMNYLYTAYRYDKRSVIPLLDLVRNFSLLAFFVYIIVVQEKEYWLCSSGGYFIVMCFYFFYGAYFIFVSYILVSLGLAVGFFNCSIQVAVLLSIFLIVSSMLFFLRMVLCNRLIHINWVKRKLFIWSMFVPDVSILYFLS